MNKRLLATFLVSLILSYLFIPPTPQIHGKPILKPRKYHGPIPRRSFTFSVGFLGGADNVDMWAHLDGLVPATFERFLFTEDFSSGVQLDLTYTVKMHPQFAFRVKGGAGFLSSQSKGKTAAFASPSDTISTLVDFTREFDVTLLSVEASGIYYFQDASVDEFQVYLGGGFSMYFPIADFDETVVSAATGASFRDLVADVSDTDTTPGVHGILGFLYHIRNSLAFNVEARAQLAQSKFVITAPTASAGVQPLSFDVDYTGFTLSLGVSTFF
ncbi:MAG: hypothetical protein V3V49_08200 [Candidatus Krumholzibacteria bacterium]